MLTQASGRLVPSVRVVIRVVLMALAGMAALIAAALLVIRFWIWPTLPHWEPRVTESLTAALSRQGLTLEMGDMTADWARWYRPRLTIDGISLFRADGERVLTIRQAQATLGPASVAALWRWQPIFHELRLVDPFVYAERSIAGDIRVAGIPLGARAAEPSALDWLLRQGRLRIDSGEIIWRDVPRDRSARFRDITLALNNRGHFHAWALKATPPAPLGEGFILQGDFRHGLFFEPSDVSRWSGRAYVQFDRVDLAELFAFVPLPGDAPLKVNSGQGALRAWADVSDSRLEDLTVDLDLTDASLQWGSGKRPMTLQRLLGRVQTQISSTRQTVSLTDVQLRSRQLASEMRVPSAVLDIRQVPEQSGLSASIKATSIDLAPAIWLVDHLPLPARWKNMLSDLRPQGKLEGLQIGWSESSEAVTSFRIETAFERLALAAGGSRPGFSDLSGRLKATEERGEVMLQSRQASLVFPGIFENPTLGFSGFSADLSWSVRHLLDHQSAAPVALSVDIRQLEADNEDAALTVSGRYEWSGNGMGAVALNGRVLRADPVRLHRYLPLVVGPQTRAWLRDALTASRPYTATFEVHGALEDFPFRDPARGRFLVEAQADGAGLVPAPGWPAISGVRAQARFERHQFRITTKGGKMGDLQLSDVEARIPDLEAMQTALRVEGGLSGDFQRFVDTVGSSALKASIGDVVGDMRGKGQTNLDLLIDLDLDDTSRSRVQGRLGMVRGTFRHAPALPEVAVTSADVAFDQDGLRQVAIQGQALGGPVRVTGTSSSAAGEQVRLAIEGQATATGLAQWLDQALGVSLKDAFWGTTRYTTTVISGADRTQVKVQTSLEGLGMSLFGPFSKRATDDWGLQVELDRRFAADGAAGPESWSVRSNRQSLNATIQRGVSTRPDETLINLESRAMAGQLRWLAASAAGARSSGAARTHASLEARLSRLWLDSPAITEEHSAEPGGSDAVAQDWPRFDLVVDDFRVGSRSWGRLDVQASPQAASRSWQIQRFSLTNSDGQLSGSGQWAMVSPPGRVPRRSRTTLDVALDVANGGDLLARSGFPGVVRDTKGKVEGRLHWPGSPLEFSGAALSGSLALDMQQGQFLKAEPGIARLVGVLNLQSLPRRIKLDFRDVFSEGFAYERIRGDLQFLNGQASTQNLRIIGVQASVMLAGSADLVSETQDLRVLVLPEVNAGLASLGYAALVNPAVGLGAFIAQYILRNPVRELLSYEYHVTGGWTDPVVELVKREMRSELPEMRPGPGAGDQPKRGPSEK